MDAVIPNSRTAAYKPALAWFAAIGSVWVFVLVSLGAFTTSIGAGMAFPDWPLSNGSLNPKGWLSDLSMFAEHSHRLSAGIMTTVTLILALWIWRTEQRAWLRRLAWFAVGLVFLQAVVGGLRVLFEPTQVTAVQTSLGQLFAMAHACLAQLFTATLVAIAAACSRSWIDHDLPANPGVRRAGVVCCALLFLQLAIAAVMRHSFAGLAIPMFPYSNIDHGLLPPFWDFRVAVNFAHRAMALILSIAIIWFAIRIRLDAATPCLMKLGATLLVILLVLQIALGAKVIWTLRNPYMTTGHVLNGALTLTLACWLTWFAHRDSIEGRS